MCGLAGYCAGGGADEKPFGGAGDASPGAAASSDAQGVVAFARESGGFLALVGEIALGGDEFCLAGFAVDGEVVERLQIFGGNDGIGLGRWRVWRCGGGFQNDRGWQGDLGGEFAHNLGGRYDSALLGRQSGESLRELIVAVVLAGVGGGEELFCGGEFGFELGTIAAVGAPGEKDG